MIRDLEATNRRIDAMILEREEQDSRIGVIGRKTDAAYQKAEANTRKLARIEEAAATARNLASQSHLFSILAMVLALSALAVAVCF